MRLFAYYAFHSFINQIKKLFKTWVAVVLAVSLLVGLVFGVVFSSLEDDEPAPEPGIYDEIIEDIEADGDIEYEPGIADGLGLEGAQMAELGFGLGILAIVMLFAFTADKSGGALFLPADTVLLFSSPITPQGALMFRVMMRLGLALFMTVYFLIELPALHDAGVSTGIAIAGIGAFGISYFFGMLIQVLLFLVGTNHPFVKKNLTNLCIGFLALIAAVFFVFYKGSGLEVGPAAAAFFNGRIARAIPLWGWIKAFPFLLYEGKTVLAFVDLFGCFAGLALIVLLIYRTKADFYEEALEAADKVAEATERLKNRGGLFVASGGHDKKKSLLSGLGKMKSSADDTELEDEPDKAEKEYPMMGFGGKAFFYKGLHVRKKNAQLGIFTKTSITYLLLAIITIIMNNKFLELNELYLSIGALSAFAFFRTLGNPMLADISMPYFRLAPSGGWSKMFWSIASGSVVCLLDSLPGMVMAAAISVGLGADFLHTLLVFAAGLLFIMSIDFYSTCAGAFIQLSLPENAGTTLKQAIQMLFLYFGLIPDILVFIIFGSNAETLGVSFGQSGLVAAALNILLGGFFMAFCPLFLWPGSRSRKDKALELTPEACKAEKPFFSKIGFAVGCFLLIATVLQLVLAFGLIPLPESLAESEYGFWLMTFGPIYLVAFPIAMLLLKRIPVKPLEKKSLGIGKLIMCLIAAQGLAYITNLLSQIIVLPAYSVSGTDYENVIMTLTSQGGEWIQNLIIVVIGPLVEELIFRKGLIDRLNVYGGKRAVIVSAVLFGLFHGNLQQIFYAAVIGLVFGYVYQRTGNILYSWILHMIVNFNGSVLSLKVLESGNETAAAVFTVAVIVVSLLSLVITFISARKLVFASGEKALPKGRRFSTIWLNPGMIFCIMLCLALTVLNIVGL